MLSLPLATLTLWLTPMWMLALGALLGLVLLLAGYGVLTLTRPEAAEAARAAIAESVLMPVLYLAGAMAVLFAIAYPQMPSREVFASLQRLPSVGTTVETIELEPRSVDVALPVSVVSEEIVTYEVESDQDIRVAGAEGLAYTAPAAVVAGGEPYRWTTKSKRARGFNGSLDAVYLTNDGDAPANVALRFETAVRTPEVKQTPITALALAGVVGLYLLLRWLAPNVSSIAAATAKEAVAQPLFLLFLLLGSVALVAFIYVPYNTFGEDVKMLKDSGLSTVMILGIVLGMWTASTSVAEEIEGKTALTVLSKPISRREFLLGKYVGILWSVLLLFVMLGVVLLACVSYKVVYDARETSNPTPDWQECHAEMVSTTPGLVLAFFEASVLTAISVAISTRLPMLPNLLICGAVYVLGHLTPLVVQSSVGKNEFVQFFGRLLSVVIPMLDHLNIQAAIAAGQSVTFGYLGMAGLYTLVYIAVAMLVALILFEDRDLA